MNDFNLNWEYFDCNVLEHEAASGVLVNLPHTNKVLPLQYFDEREYQFVSSYRKTIRLQKEAHRCYILSFEGVMMKATLYVNRRCVAESLLGYLGFTHDITEYLVDGVNEILVVTDSRESVNAAPFGGLIDYCTFGGIYREAHFEIKNETYIQNVKATYTKDSFSIELLTSNEDFETVCISVNGSQYRFPRNADNLYCITQLPDLILWDLENPHLYNIKVEIESDSYSFQYGFRTIQIKDNLLTLNGKTIKIRGLNRHQSYPYIGYAGTKNMQVIDAEILKKLGVNTVRTSHYPQSTHFLDACDRLGLLVFEEIPGWQHLGDEAWKQTVIANTARMIERDYNHPSVVIWGVRVNESQDCDELYEKTNALAHKLDPTRPTTGVRFIKESSLQEDIYAFNDFSYTKERYIEAPMDVTGLSHKVPYLISEFGGHTYPTKKIDNEERQMEQLLRHMRIQHAANASNDIMGAIGWCAFDYNTHLQFGSGDKICYHGVMDIFRMPKLASMFYRGQIKRADEIVLEIATIFGYGERSFGGVTPLYAFSNCDSLILEVDGGKVYPFEIDREYSTFDNPIFVLRSMDGGWGLDWKNATVYGYINGKEAVRKRLLANQLPADLDIRLYNEVIEYNDATRIEVRMVDAAGNTLRFDSSVLHIEVENCQLMGPDQVALYGGEYAFYVRGNHTGTAGVHLKCNAYEKEITFEVRG